MRKIVCIKNHEFLTSRGLTLGSVKALEGFGFDPAYWVEVTDEPFGVGDSVVCVDSKSMEYALTPGKVYAVRKRWADGIFCMVGEPDANGAYGYRFLKLKNQPRDLHMTDPRKAESCEEKHIRLFHECAADRARIARELEQVKRERDAAREQSKHFERGLTDQCRATDKMLDRCNAAERDLKVVSEVNNYHKRVISGQIAEIHELQEELNNAKALRYTNAAFDQLERNNEELRDKLSKSEAQRYSVAQRVNELPLFLRDWLNHGCEGKGVNMLTADSGDMVTFYTTPNQAGCVHGGRTLTHKP